MKQGLFKADVTSSKPAFSMILPPPNVTGKLHLGHA
jgi:valyl-tRNA synthetase